MSQMILQESCNQTPYPMVSFKHSVIVMIKIMNLANILHRYTVFWVLKILRKQEWNLTKFIGNYQVTFCSFTNNVYKAVWIRLY